MPEHRISSTAEAPKGGVDLLKTQQTQKELGEQLREIANRGTEPNGSVQVGPVDPDQIQMVAQDSVLVEIPGPRYIEIGPPPQATPLLVSQILASETDKGDVKSTISTLTDMNVIKALLYIRAINGQMAQMVRNMAEAKQMLNFLGDRGIETIQVCMQEYWPAPVPSTIKVLKKNLRG